MMLVLDDGSAWIETEECFRWEEKESSKGRKETLFKTAKDNYVIKSVGCEPEIALPTHVKQVTLPQAAMWFQLNKYNLPETLMTSKDAYKL